MRPSAVSSNGLASPLWLRPDTLENPLKIAGLMPRSAPPVTATLASPAISASHAVWIAAMLDAQAASTVMLKPRMPKTCATRLETELGMAPTAAVAES